MKLQTKNVILIIISMSRFNKWQSGDSIVLNILVVSSASENSKSIWESRLHISARCEICSKSRGQNLASGNDATVG